MNINSIQNKLTDLKISVFDSVDILCIAESKLDKSFLKSEIVLDGFKKPYRLDLTTFSGGLLVYIKASLPSKIINHYEFQKDIQCVVMELKVSNKKYVIFSIYGPPKQYKLLLQLSIGGTWFLFETWKYKHENTWWF